MKYDGPCQKKTLLETCIEGCSKRKKLKHFFLLPFFSKDDNTWLKRTFTWSVLRAGPSIIVMDVS